MIDFKITNIGDVCIEHATILPSFVIHFHCQKHPAFRIDFDTDIQHYDISEHTLQMDFSTDLNRDKIKICAPSVIEKEELAQQITIRFKTELGEFPFLKDFGSELSSIRHADIKSDTTHELAKEYAQAALNDVETENPFTINVSWVDDTSRYKYERLKISVDTERDTIYEADI